MEKVSMQNAGFYPGCSPVGAVDNSNSATEKFRTLIKQELKFQLAQYKVSFYQDTIDRFEKKLTKAQVDIVRAELADAQRECAQQAIELKQCRQNS